MGAAPPPHHVDARTVKVFVPGPLRPYCGGARELALSAASVRTTLEELEREYPALYRNVCDETGAVRRHINVFVNSEHMRDRDGLDTELSSGDTIIILPAVSGG
jgi:molybdopterin converting factor small subunit